MDGTNDRRVSAVVLALASLGGVYVALSGSPFVGWALAAVAGWFALDVLYDLRHGIERAEPRGSDLDEMSYGGANRVIYRAARVKRALETSPASLSVSELTTRTDLSEAEVSEALSLLEESNTVFEKRERYALDEERPGLIRSTIRRLIRPLSLVTPSR